MPMGEFATWVEFFKTLGIAGPLVGFLVFIYNKTDSERRDTQSKFLDALQTTMLTNAQDRQANTSSLVELTATIRERETASSQEHEKMLSIMQRIAERLEVPRTGGRIATDGAT